MYTIHGQYFHCSIRNFTKPKIQMPQLGQHSAHCVDEGNINFNVLQRQFLKPFAATAGQLDNSMGFQLNFGIFCFFLNKTKGFSERHFVFQACSRATSAQDVQMHSNVRRSVKSSKNEKIRTCLLNFNLIFLV